MHHRQAQLRKFRSRRLLPASGLIFPIDDQKALTGHIEGYLAKGGTITFLTFDGVDHMGSAHEFYHINAVRDWLFRQVRR